jgi:FkbM family methyltransferase
MFYSQDKQDELLETYVFREHRRGVFVDVGAWDGVTFSNTLFFEKERGWSGIHIEPLKDQYEALVKNRPHSVNLNVAVSDFNGETEFLSIPGPTSMLSGITSNYDPRHIERIALETSALNTQGTTVTVPVRRLDSIFREHNTRRVHYLSIDAEGSEMNIIRSIDFEFTYIDVIGFENNYDDKTRPIIEFLQQKGYIKLPIKSYDVFMVRANSPFRPQRL